MKIDREVLLKHLHRVYCSGQFGEIVLRPDFSVAAMTTNELLAVQAPGIEKVTKLKAPVGVIDLKLLIAALGMSSEGQVAIDFKDNRIIIAEKHRAKLRLVTGSPEIIGTAISDEIVEALEANLPPLGDEDLTPLPQSVIEAILETRTLLDAEQVELTTGPKGSTVRLGYETGHNAEIEIPSLTSADSYKLLLDAKILCDCLRQVDDFTQTFLVLTGEDAVVALDTAYYRYIISPLSAGE